MFNEIEKRSVNAIIEKQAVITEKTIIEAYKNRTEENQLIEDVSVEGEKIFGINKAGRVWYMQSRYSSEKAAKMWAKQYEKVISDNAIFLIFGMSDGMCIRELLEYNEECIVIIYEPCIEVFWHEFGRESVAELLESGRVFLLVQGINEALLLSYMDEFLNYANFQLVQNGSLPNYDRVFPEEYRWMLDQYLYEVKKIVLNRNTEIMFNREIIGNMLSLSGDIIEHSSVLQLKNIIEEKQLKSMPAVLVSAGPSLDKNIDQLRLIQDSVFIMAVDTALNTTLQHGIMPDMTISVDGHKPLKLFSNEKVKDIPIVLSAQSNKDILSMVSERRFYELSPDEFLASYYREIGKTTQALPTGGSVANNALALLVMMGFETVIFMGQDLAYPQGKTHTVEAYEEEDFIDKKSGKYVITEDIYGNEVYTEPNMLCYLKWFEYFISVSSEVRYIDATEGGARIIGTELKSMQEVVVEFGGKNFDKSIIFRRVGSYLSKEEQEDLKGKIEAIPEELERLKKTIQSGLRIYEKMDEINRKRGNSTNRIVRLMNDIMELNQELDENVAFSLVRYYAIEVDYGVKGSVLQYDENEEFYEQIKDIIAKGKTLLEGYLKGAKELEEDIKKFVKDF